MSRPTNSGTGAPDVSTPRRLHSQIGDHLAPLAEPDHVEIDLGDVLGKAVARAGRTDTFLGARYRRIARRRGKKKAIVAVGRSLLVIIWHLLADPNTRFHKLGADHYDRHVNTHAKRRNHVRQLEALGYRVILQPAA